MNKLGVRAFFFYGFSLHDLSSRDVLKNIFVNFLKALEKFYVPFILQVIILILDACFWRKTLGRPKVQFVNLLSQEPNFLIFLNQKYHADIRNISNCDSEKSESISFYKPEETVLKNRKILTLKGRTCFRISDHVYVIHFITCRIVYNWKRVDDDRISIHYNR